MSTLTYTGQLVVTSCWCGVHLAVPQDLYQIAQRKQRHIYCPLGHTFVYGDPENEQLRSQVEDLKTRLTHARDDAQHQRTVAEAERRSAAARKGQLTKAFNRLRAGVCPLCRRNFPALGEHMRHEHPTAVPDLEAEPTP